jgi:hypothetical protein
MVQIDDVVVSLDVFREKLFVIWMLAKDNVALRVMPVRLWKRRRWLNWRSSSGYLGSTFTTGSRDYRQARSVLHGSGW